MGEIKLLSGKYAVVTGGTQGLGVAVSQLFVENGIKGLVICGRNEEKGHIEEQKIKEQGVDAEFVKADLADVEACRRVIRAADTRFGQLDILVNVAGMTDRGTILDTSQQLFDSMFAVNVRAPFFLIQEAAKLFIRDQIEGAVVNISSMSALAGQPFISAYSASKGALDTLTRNVAYSLLRNRIRVNALDIGWMETEGEHHTQKTYHGADENWAEEAAKKLPFGRLLSPREVARAILFLASEQSGMMTGACINFDQSVWGGYDYAPLPPAPLHLE